MKDARVAVCLLRPCLSEKSDPAVREAAAAALRELGVSVPSRAEAVRLLPTPRRHISSGMAESRATPTARRNCGDGTKPSGSAWRRHARPATWLGRSPHAGLATPTPGARRPVGSAFSTWPRCSKRQLTRTAWIGRWTRRIPRWSKPGSSARRPIEEVLKYAMAHGRSAAAAAAARLWARSARPAELLYRAPGRRRWLGRPVARPPAANGGLGSHRPAATAQPFAGSSYVLQALGFFAASSGFRHALVACSEPVEARELAGMLVGGRLPGRHVHQRQGIVARGPRDRPTTSWR